MDEILKRVKRLKGISDNHQDDLLNEIIELTTEKLKNKLPNRVIPPELNHIIVEVSVKRFNRLGSEGMVKKSLEGLTTEFSDDDFKEYNFNNEGTDSGTGTVMFF